MKFCPKCGTRLKLGIINSRSLLYCEKCGNRLSPQDAYTDEQVYGELKVVGEKEQKIRLMPTVAEKCEKCGCNTAYWWMTQYPNVAYFRCEECGHTWRIND